MNENSYNKNKDTKLLIGTAKINDLGVLYSVLNEKIYELFSKRIKDVAYDDKIEINYNHKEEDEEEINNSQNFGKEEL